MYAAATATAAAAPPGDRLGQEESLLCWKLDPVFSPCVPSPFSHEKYRASAPSTKES